MLKSFTPLMRFCLHLLVLCGVVTGSVNVAQSQEASKALINPPSWILGRWLTGAESNTDNWETFEFTTADISYTKGFLDSAKVVSLSGEFKGYKVKETIEPNLYRVEFSKGKNELVYEFKPCETDACKTFSGSDALTYSIIKNKKVVRAHETSINLFLLRRMPVK